MQPLYSTISVKKISKKISKKNSPKNEKKKLHILCIGRDKIGHDFRSFLKLFFEVQKDIKKDARISPDTSQLVFLPYLRLPVNVRNQLLCIIGHSSFICVKFCLSYSVCLSCMRPCHLHTYFQVLPLIFHTAMPHSHWH